MAVQSHGRCQRGLDDWTALRYSLDGPQATCWKALWDMLIALRECLGSRRKVLEDCTARHQGTCNAALPCNGARVCRIFVTLSIYRCTTSCDGLFAHLSGGQQNDSNSLMPVPTALCTTPTSHVHSFRTTPSMSTLSLLASFAKRGARLMTPRCNRMHTLDPGGPFRTCVHASKHSQAD